jgi:KDO2-lipid IV(A) lauroyltransferase
MACRRLVMAASLRKLAAPVKPLRDHLEYGLLLSLVRLAGWSPQGFSFAVAKGIATTVFWLGFRRRRITLCNLALAFPEMPAPRRRVLGLAVYHSLGRTFAETLLILSGKWGGAEILERVRDPDGVFEELRRLQDEGPGGVMLVTAHFGNWELLAAYYALRGQPLEVIGRPGDNPLIERHMTRKLRECFGNRLLSKEHAARPVMRLLRQGAAVGILADQKVRRSEAVEVCFFGQSALATPAPALLADRGNHPLLFSYLVREADGGYRIVGSRTLFPQEFGGDRKTRLQGLTQAFHSQLEQIIRDYPEQWFWMHNRWRCVAKKRGDGGR